MDLSISSTVWFTLRTDKTNKDGKAPINGFYSLNGKRLRFATDKSLCVFPQYWNAESKSIQYINTKERKKATFAERY